MTNSDWYEKCFYRVSLKALIRNEKNEILMVRETRGDFSLPGGGWDYEEELHQALKRELYEELLLTSDFTERIITTIPFYNPGKSAWQMWVACEISYDELNYSVGADANEVRWVEESEIDPTTLAGN